VNGTQPLNRRILRLDALFLVLAGSVQLVLEIAGHSYALGFMLINLDNRRIPLASLRHMDWRC